MPAGRKYDAKAIDPKCEQCKENCFAYNEGRCRLLTNTKFNKPCPFFKTKAKAAADWAKYGGVPNG